MALNADLDARVVIDTRIAPWIASREPGVECKLLDAIDDGPARATSIVRYPPGSAFLTHQPVLGEELFVLAGAFADERGDYSTGTYLWNAPGARHRSFTASGCELLVSLRAVRTDDDDTRVVVDTRRARWRPGLVPGLSVLPLHEAGTAHVALVRWAPGTRFQAHAHWGGEEIFVLDGVFSDELGDHAAGTWIRSPHLSRHQPFSEPGCLIYVKVGDLPDR